MSKHAPNSHSKQPVYFTVFDLLFELVAAGLLSAGCAYLGAKLSGWLGGFLGGVCGPPLWVAFRYAQYRYAIRQKGKP